MDDLYPKREIDPLRKLSEREQSTVEYYRTVVGTIQKSPYYVELNDAHISFERYTDKYSKEKDNTKLSSFYSYDTLSKYVPTELLGERDIRVNKAMQLSLPKVTHHAELEKEVENGNEREDEENPAPAEGDDLNQDVAYEDEDVEYGYNFEDSEGTFGIEDDGDDGAVYN